MSDIGRKKFTDAFTRLGWKSSSSNSNKYTIWTSPLDAELWTRVPMDELSEEYFYYQNKNIKLLLYFLGLEENKENFSDLYSQLLKSSYKLINRIVNVENHSNESVPFELANTLTEKNIEAFRSFSLLRAKGKKSIPLEKFELNHSQKGSFVIPISIDVEEDKNSLPNIPTETSAVLQDYLNTVDRLVKLPITDAYDYAKNILERDIDSKIVRDFLGWEDGIAKYKNKYSNKVKDMSISASGSPILDYQLTYEEKHFKNVELNNITALSDDYIQQIDILAAKQDTSTIEGTGVHIDVIMDTISSKGKAKFTVWAINGHEVKKPFKAITVELTKKNLDFCADAIKSGNRFRVLGDISKPKRRMGKIVASTLELIEEDPNNLFNPINK